jgi:hypothetical protein
MRKLGIVALCAMVAGCQTAQALATASGKPEVTIRAKAGAVKARLLSLAMDRRFSVTKDTEYLLQLDKPTENLGAAILLGSRYDSTPSERFVFTIAPIGDSVRVEASSMFVTNPVSAFKRITPVNAGEGVDRTQSTLEELNQSIEAPSTAPVASTRKPKQAS